MTERSHAALDATGKPPVSIGLLLFCYALLGPGCAINAVFVALAIPAAAPYGVTGLLVAAAIGLVLGIVPARWLARRIAEGLAD